MEESNEKREYLLVPEKMTNHDATKGPRGSIWRLVEECAKKLTRGGLGPFTRGDIIACVQSKNPRYGPDSINPIIQGVTDNLRGGAPGSVGKNVLHSVGRGLFMLRSVASQAVVTDVKKAVTTAEKKPARGFQSPRHSNSSAAKKSTIRLGQYKFSFAADIDPIRDDDGQIKEFMPQSAYDNRERLPLNRYGKGPFCKFKIPRYMQTSGVYALLVNDNARYVGETQNLSDRFNMGYGNISPRNCFIGGQETNCRINHLILEKVKVNSCVTLWFHATDNYKSVEDELRGLLSFSWNKS